MTDIHRLLDQAFAGVTMTPELQDLKEELRGNLLARADELQSNGMDAAKAASNAVAEVDIPELIAGIAAEARPANSLAAQVADLARLNRVRPTVGFVVRATVLSILAAVAAAVVVVTGLKPSALNFAAVIVFGLAIGALTSDSLRKETAQHYPMPIPRTLAWGAAAAALSTGLAWAVPVVADAIRPGRDLLVGSLIIVVALTAAGIVGLIALGVTQTNRTKPWALAQQRQYEVDDRFSQDPVAAARFGIYTVVIWTIAIALFVVLSISVGFAWSWLALVAGLAVFFLVLARMLFPSVGAKKQ
jgi:hypothetical protein